MPLRGGNGSRDRGGWVRYGVPGAALGLVLAWWLGGRAPSARAQVPPAGSAVVPIPLGAGGVRPAAPGLTSTPPAEANGTVVFTSPAGGSAQLLYLIDTRARAFAVYRVDPANPKGAVKLEAARQYQWDLKLSDYNNLEPRPDAIESTVKSLGQPPSR